MNKGCKLFTLIIVILSTFAAAQTTREYGIVAKEDLDYSSFPGDPEATAVVMFHVGKVGFVNTTLDIRVLITKRVKILKEAGLSRAEVSIFYYGNGFGKTETIKDIEAISYNSENGVIERKVLLKENIFTEKVNDKWNKKTFSIPGVKVGSIIEYKYERITPFISEMPDWEFQSDIPTLHSALSIGMVPFYEYATIVQGISKFDKQESNKEPRFTRSFGGIGYRDLIYEFELNNVPAFYDDDYITSRNDYIKKIDFQLSQINNPSGSKVKYMTTWDELAEKLKKSDYFGRYIKSVEKIGKSQLLPEIPLIGKSEQEKVQILTDYVKDNYTWDRRLGKYASQSAKNFHKSLKGSSGDINLFLLGLLRAAGIEANPVILSTRSHGKINVNYPFSQYFNMVIIAAEIPEGILKLDATNRTLPFYLMSTQCLNGSGLLLDQDNLSWMDLTPSFLSSVKESTSVTVDPENMQTNYITNERSTRYYAENGRNSYENDEDDFFDSRLGDDQEMTAQKVENLTDRESPFIFKYSKSGPTEIFKDDLYVFPLSTSAFQSNPFLNKKREYPVDFVYQKQRIYASNILCPSGYKIKAFPGNVQIDNDMLSFDYKVTPLPGGQNLSFEVLFVTKQVIYEVEQYEELKELFKQVYSQMAKKIVFEKL